jgi:hypothetical protein
MTDEYEWLAVSEALYLNLDIEALFDEGWEFVGGALRKLKNENEPRSNRT